MSLRKPARDGTRQRLVSKVLKRHNVAYVGMRVRTRGRESGEREGVCRCMYQRKVDVDMLNAVKSMLTLRCSAYPHQPYVDTLYILQTRRRRPKLVLTGTSILFCVGVCVCACVCACVCVCVCVCACRHTSVFVSIYMCACERMWECAPPFFHFTCNKRSCH